MKNISIDKGYDVQGITHDPPSPGMLALLDIVQISLHMEIITVMIRASQLIVDDMICTIVVPKFLALRLTTSLRGMSNRVLDAPLPDFNLLENMLNSL